MSQTTDAENNEIVGYWLVPNNEAYIKAPIRKFYRVENKPRSFFAQPFRIEEIVRDDLVLPGWTVIAGRQQLDHFFPWIGRFVSKNKADIYRDTEHTTSVLQSLQSLLFSHGWSFCLFKAGSSIGFFGTDGDHTNLPEYWQPFLRELEGAEYQMPEWLKVNSQELKKFIFVNAHGEHDGKAYDIRRLRS